MEELELDLHRMLRRGVRGGGSCSARRVEARAPRNRREGANSDDGGSEGMVCRCLRLLRGSPPAAATSSSSPPTSSATTASAATAGRWPGRPSSTAWPPRASTSAGPTTRTRCACRRARPCSRASTSGPTAWWPTGSPSRSTRPRWRSTCTTRRVTAPRCSARPTSSRASTRRTSGRRTPGWPAATVAPGAASSAPSRPCTRPPGATIRSRITAAGSRRTTPNTCTASRDCSRPSRAGTRRRPRRRTTRFRGSGTTPTGWPTSPSNG